MTEGAGSGDMVALLVVRCDGRHCNWVSLGDAGLGQEATQFRGFETLER